MQEFKKNLINLIEQYGVACGDVAFATARRARDMGKELIECRAECDKLYNTIIYEVDKITFSNDASNKVSYKAGIYGPNFLIDSVDIDGNRETVVHLKVGMSFKKANREFQELTGKQIKDIRLVRVFDCFELQDFDSNKVEKHVYWIVTDEFGKVLQLVDLT